MPGLFDGMRISTSGINTYRLLEEVIGQNIANASNENYSRQQVRLNSLGSTFDGQYFFGQGVGATEIVRVRDELLDEQLRSSTSYAAAQTYKLDWLKNIESIFNEPSDWGINSALTNFWESFSELATDPQSLATRSDVVTRTGNLADILNSTDGKLEQLTQDLDQELLSEIGNINALTDEIARLNADIFEIEAGKEAQANDLRDARDAALDKLSESVKISYNEASNGMVNVSIGSHPAVSGDVAERLVAKSDPIDASRLLVMWEHGERLGDVKEGNLSAILELRDTTIAHYRDQINTLATTMIEQINAIYSNGAGLQPHTLMESNLGYEALGVSSATKALNLVDAGETGEMHVTFYDEQDNAVRMAGIVIDEGDSLQDIALKLNGIAGLSASLLTDDANDGRLSITLDSFSGDNVMGEASFTLTNDREGFDTSGVLDMLGFSSTDKSTNDSATLPVLSSRDLTELQTTLGESTIAGVRSHALNLSGTFTINAFETGSETPPKTDGHMVQQLAIEVESSDTIDDIMAKVNALSAKHGIAMSFNGGTNKLEFTSTARTDAEGNLLLAGGTDTLRLGFANAYRYPLVNNDAPPARYNGHGDSTNLLAKLQFNTLFQGSSASDIALDSKITGPSQIHAGYTVNAGDNQLALDIVELQHALITGDGQFTIGEQYTNTIADIGTAILRTDNLASNESTMLEGYRTERSSISGVNLDEELANMIMYQRAYEANARMFSTFSKMAEELLQIV